ncbi:Mu transposase C-terminal domain-containing protein [Gordonia bronchialis]|uniref:Mu transposase C-terminal domain-containing protein n=1 Tax=Gordonia bronchialis TaxID=2054 RepID=UPI001CBD8950|nr:Mu transposase C-terminal domain-containing protein [Gordonia bronchialis]UAK39187.1 Mu transposase C-terminal domain-containing protein [Gordonia bronchialis]
MIDVKVGDEIGLRGDRWLVTSCDGVSIVLQCNSDATTIELATSELLADESLIAARANRSLADVRILNQLSPERRRDAEFWYEQMHLVKYGLTSAERARFGDIAVEGTVAERLAMRRDDLRGRGIAVSMSSMWRRYGRFRKLGIVGCADHRGLPGHTRGSGVDARVYACLAKHMRRFEKKSTPSKKQVIEYATEELEEVGVTVPKRSRMYELLKELDRGEHTFGEASTRRSLANSPDRAFGKIRQLYPGQELQLDSTPLDALVLTPDGRTERADLALAIDVATRTIASAILRPKAASSVDATELLTKAMRPMQMHPEWEDAMSWARSILPHDMLPADVLAEHAAARPIIDIRGVFVDRGRIYVSEHFVRVLEMQGMNHRIASPRDPTNKPIVERTLRTIGEDFVRWMTGYKGRAIVHRGSHPEAEPLWPLTLIQPLLDEWVVSVYQPRSHSGLSLDVAPAMPVAPNEMYSGLTEFIPGRVRALTRDEWISLQPCDWRRINRYGINFERLIYDNDGARFHELRRSKSPNRQHDGRWEIRYDPGNMMRIWLRDEERQEWIECKWIRAKDAPTPFALDVLRHVVKLIGDKRHEIDAQVLRKLVDIHKRLGAGPPTNPTPQDKDLKPALEAAARGQTRAALRAVDAPAPEGASEPSERQPRNSAYVPPVQPLSAVRTTDKW